MTTNKDIQGAASTAEALKKAEDAYTAASRRLQTATQQLAITRRTMAAERGAAAYHGEQWRDEIRSTGGRLTDEVRTEQREAAMAAERAQELEGIIEEQQQLATEAQAEEFAAWSAWQTAYDRASAADVTQQLAAATAKLTSSTAGRDFLLALRAAVAMWRSEALQDPLIGRNRAADDEALRLARVNERTADLLHELMDQLSAKDLQREPGQRLEAPQRSPLADRNWRPPSPAERHRAAYRAQRPSTDEAGDVDQPSQMREA